MDIKNKIENLIKEVLKNLNIEGGNFSVEHPVDLKMGDYSTNVAMVFAKELKTNPKELAEKIVNELSARQDLAEIGISKIQIAGPGFINFYLAPEFFSESLEEILNKKENFGKNNRLEGKKEIIEYTDPNPFKEFHIGHLMPNTIGESISRIIEASGAEVKRACYQGDVGLHVAKTIWGLQKAGFSKVENNHDSAVAYALGSKSYEDHKEEINEINKNVYERSDEKINQLYDSGKEKSLEYFETIYKKLGTKFDFYFFESETGILGKDIVLKNIGNVFEKSDGAIVFKGENFKPSLHTRVFVNKEGLPTYEAKELGLAKIKYGIYPYTNSVVITGNEVNEYFKVLLEAMEQVFPDLAEKTKHISHGMLRLPSGKMSSRTGDVITAESLLSDIGEKVKEKVKDTKREEMGDEFINQVSVASLKYSILRQAIGGDIIFDFDKSISFEGDSGPYLQYSYARAKSILEKGQKENISVSPAMPNNWTTTEVEKILYQFPEVVSRSSVEFAPHHIANYLIELARAFNNFYGNNQIVKNDDETSPYKLAITEAFSVVIKNGLYLLGIETPERM